MYMLDILGSGQPDSLTESPCLGLLPHSSPSWSFGRNPHPRCVLFKYKAVQSSHTNHFLYWALIGPLPTCPNDPRARYQTARDNCFVPEPTGVIQASQSITYLTCLACFFPRKLQWSFLSKSPPTPKFPSPSDGSWCFLVCFNTPTHTLVLLLLGNCKKLSFTGRDSWSVILTIKFSINILYFKTAV